MIAQQKSPNQVHKLIVNETRNRETVVTLQAEEDEVYEVVIFPIREGNGILDSDMEYSEVVMVNNSNKDTTSNALIVIGNKVSNEITLHSLRGHGGFMRLSF